MLNNNFVLGFLEDTNKLNMEAQSQDNETKTNPGQYLPDVLLGKHRPN